MAATAPTGFTPAPTSDAAAGAGRVQSSGDAALAKRLRAYLKKKGSPLAAHAEHIVAAGRRNNVDPRLIVAISGAESGFGKKNFRPYNAWGWMSGHFTSWRDGIDTVARGLRKGYLSEGRTSVRSISTKYCPVGASNDPKGTNAYWPKMVGQFYKELGGNPSDVRRS